MQQTDHIKSGQLMQFTLAEAQREHKLQQMRQTTHWERFQAFVALMQLSKKIELAPKKHHPNW
jgi:hypothetical protein